MLTRTKESKPLIIHISCDCKCKLDSKKMYFKEKLE